MDKGGMTIGTAEKAETTTFDGGYLFREDDPKSEAVFSEFDKDKFFKYQAHLRDINQKKAEQRDKFSREGAKKTLSRVEKFEDLNADTVEESDEKFKQKTKELWGPDITTHWKQRDVEKRKKYIKENSPGLITDLDARVSMALLDVVAKVPIALDEEKTFVKPGGEIEDRIMVDTGNEEGVVSEWGFRDSSDKDSFNYTKTAYTDHHHPDLSQPGSSAAKYFYEELVALGTIHRTAALERLVHFVTHIDNKSYPGAYEKYDTSYKTLIGLADFMPFDKLLQFFEEGRDPEEELSESDVKKYGITEKKFEFERDKVKRNIERVDALTEKGDFFETGEERFGKVLVNIQNTDADRIDQSAAIYRGYDTVLSWNVNNKTFFIGSRIPFPEDFKLSQGVLVRRTMYVKGEDDKSDLTITLEEIINAMSGGAAAPEGDLVDYLDKERKGEILPAIVEDTDPEKYAEYAERFWKSLEDLLERSKSTAFNSVEQYKNYYQDAILAAAKKGQMVLGITGFEETDKAKFAAFRLLALEMGYIVGPFQIDKATVDTAVATIEPDPDFVGEIEEEDPLAKLMAEDELEEDEDTALTRYEIGEVWVPANEKTVNAHLIIGPDETDEEMFAFRAIPGATYEIIDNDDPRGGIVVLEKSGEEERKLAFLVKDFVTVFMPEYIKGANRENLEMEYAEHRACVKKEFEIDLPEENPWTGVVAEIERSKPEEEAPEVKNRDEGYEKYLDDEKMIENSFAEGTVWVPAHFISGGVFAWKGERSDDKIVKTNLANRLLKARRDSGQKYTVVASFGAEGLSSGQIALQGEDNYIYIVRAANMIKELRPKAIDGYSVAAKHEIEGVFETWIETNYPYIPTEAAAGAPEGGGEAETPVDLGDYKARSEAYWKWMSESGKTPESIETVKKHMGRALMDQTPGVILLYVKEGLNESGLEYASAYMQMAEELSLEITSASYLPKDKSIKMLVNFKKNGDTGDVKNPGGDDNSERPVADEAEKPVKASAGDARTAGEKLLDFIGKKDTPRETGEVGFEEFPKRINLERSKGSLEGEGEGGKTQIITLALGQKWDRGKAGGFKNRFVTIESIRQTKDRKVQLKFLEEEDYTEPEAKIDIAEKFARYKRIKEDNPTGVPEKAPAKKIIFTFDQVLTNGDGESTSVPVEVFPGLKRVWVGARNGEDVTLTVEDGKQVENGDIEIKFVENELPRRRSKDQWAKFFQRSLSTEEEILESESE